MNDHRLKVSPLVRSYTAKNDEGWKKAFHSVSFLASVPFVESQPAKGILMRFHGIYVVSLVLFFILLFHLSKALRFFFV